MAQESGCLTLSGRRLIVRIGLFFKELQDAFGWSRTTISGASSLAFLIMGGGAAAAGGLNDRIGPRIILTTSAVATGIGYLLMAGIQNIWQLYLLYGGLVGLGFATHDVITLSTTARWFVKRRGTMSGLLKVGTGAGQLTVPLITSSLIAAYGWRQTVLILGGFFSIFTIIVHIVPHARDIGLSPAIAVGLLSTIDGVSMLGRIVMERLTIDWEADNR
jgi:MFS family permease